MVSMMLASSTKPSSRMDAHATSDCPPRIYFESKYDRFTLRGKSASYVFRIDDGELIHEHWGPSIADLDSPFVPSNPSGWRSRLSVVRREFPDLGRGDFRTPAIRVLTGAGHSTIHLRYESHEIADGKPEIAGLPATFGNAKSVSTLSVKLRDEESGLQATLFYSLFPEYDAIARHVELTNGGKESIFLQEIASFSVDLPPASYEMLQLSGDWARERQEIRRRVAPGTQGIQSRNGASGHEHNPFLALLAEGTTDEAGDVFGLSFVYSGSFSAQIEQEPAGLVRMTMGLNPTHFNWKLDPEASFTSPEAVGIYSGCGISDMSRHYHDLYRACLARSPWQPRLRPVLINNWEATYFDFDADTILRIAKEAKQDGVQLMVLDDGWFGGKYPRNGDSAGLGDWFANKAKLPEGVDGLARAVNDLGMRFGIWVEPEMVNRKSELYEAHPDWVLHAGSHIRTEQRNQLTLNFARPEVQDHIIAQLTKLFSDAPIGYVKWDMNRGMHEVDSPSTPHAYMLGFYRVLDTLTKRFPDILFEGCASGGGRFDPALLHYFCQSWTSDNTDGGDRLAIQFGTSLVYPPSSMGGHVSAVPNHQNGRVTKISFRAHVAMMCGSFGFELDLAKLPSSDRQQIPNLIKLFQAIQPVVHHGDFYRLAVPRTSNWPAAMFVSKDKAHAVVLAYQVRHVVNVSPPPLRLRGLDTGARYHVQELDEELEAQTLVNHGLMLGFYGDFDSTVVRLERV